MTATRLPASPVQLIPGDRVTNVTFPHWGPATVETVQIADDDGKIYVAARYDATGEVWSGTQQAYALAADETDDRRTWTFAADEGATVTVTSSARHLTIETERSGYDGRRSTELVFVQHTDTDEFPAGTHDNTERGAATRVLVPKGTDPRDAHADYLRAELGHYLTGYWLTSQPEPTVY